MSEEVGVALVEVVDHLVYAVPDLNEGIDAVEHRLGVRPAIGGRHPAWGTHNAVLALSHTAYLEVIAPDPEHPIPADRRPAIFSSDGTPHMIGWFAKMADLDSATSAVAAMGHRLGSMTAGSRTLPNGCQLNWRLTDPTVAVCDGIFPMLIDWGTSPHPAASAPPGCHLRQLHLQHPNADLINKLLAAASLPAGVHRGRRPQITAMIDTPKGPVSFP